MVVAVDRPSNPRVLILVMSDRRLGAYVAPDHRQNRNGVGTIHAFMAPSAGAVVDAAVRGDPDGHGEELPHVAADGGIAAAVLLDPVGGKPVKLGVDVVGPGVGRGCVEEPQGAPAVEIVGVAEVAGDEPVALVVDDPFDDVVLLAAVPAERQRVEPPGPGRRARTAARRG